MVDRYFIQWETAHDGISCEEFAEWKKSNDPELQAQGLAAYLNEEGIGRINQHAYIAKQP